MVDREASEKENKFKCKHEHHSDERCQRLDKMMTKFKDQLECLHQMFDQKNQPVEDECEESKSYSEIDSDMNILLTDD